LCEHLLALVAEEGRRDEARHGEQEDDDDAGLDAADCQRNNIADPGTQRVGPKRMGGQENASVDAPEDGDESEDHHRDRTLREGEHNCRLAEQKRERLRNQPQAEKRRVDKAMLSEDRYPGESPHQYVGQEGNQHQQPEKQGFHPRSPRLRSQARGNETTSVIAVASRLMRTVVQMTVR